jgi:hypothetical protein
LPRTFATGLKTTLQLNVESASEYYAIDPALPRRTDERAAFASELAGVIFLHLLDPLVRAEEGVLRHVG